MRIVVVLLAAAGLAGNCGAQEATKFPSDPASPIAPWTVAEAFRVGQFNGTIWSLSIEFHQPDHPLLKRTDLAAAFKAFVEADHPELTRDDDRKNLSLLKEHSEVFAQVFGRIPDISGEPRIDILDDGKNRALLMARRGEARCLIVPTLAVPTVYNTLRTEDRERATKVATSIAIPALRALASIDGLQSSGVTCVGVGVSYASKNFASKLGLDSMPKTEYVGVVASIADLQLFAAGELAEEELLGRSDVFLQDRTMIAEVKKVMMGVRP
jgi:hypothetical protein